MSSLAVGDHMTGLCVGQALGGFGAAVADRLSWQASFHAFGAAGVLYGGVLAIGRAASEARQQGARLSRGRRAPADPCHNLRYWA